MSPYEKDVREIAAKIGKVGYDPNQILGWMYDKHNALDHLSPAQFRQEVAEACELIDADPGLAKFMASTI